MNPLLLMYGSLPQQREVRWLAAGDPLPTMLVFLAEERSVFDPSAPTYAPIAEAFRSATLPPDAGGGAWIGPGPRVTRTAKPGERFGTFAAWIYQWPSPPTQAVVDTLRSRLQEALGRVTSGWQDVTFSPYSEGINGQIDWWRCASGGSACAQITHTRDEFPFFAGRLDPDENHVGPTTAATHPTTVLDAANKAADSGKSAVMWAIGAAAVIGTGYVGVKWYETYSSNRKRGG